MRKFLFVFMLCMTIGMVSGFANTFQESPPPPAAPGGPPPPGLPIDAGLIILLIAGVGLGIIFLKFKKRNTTA